MAAAAMALLATSSGGRASDSEQSAIPSVIASKRQNEDEHTPLLVLAPSLDSGILIADHSSHASHSSHYSSSGGGDDTPPAPDITPPAPPATTSPYTPPAPSPPPEPTPPQATQLDSAVLNKLAQLSSFWPKQVKLIQRFAFTEIKDGVAVGIIGAPPGTIVDLISVKGAKLVVSYLGNRAEIDASITDIGDRVDINAIVSAPLPISPVAPSSARTNSSPQGAAASSSSGATGMR
jgi:hypothetical protein